MNSTVYVIDDDRMARESLKWLVESAHLDVAVFESGQQFMQDYIAGSPGCLLLDVRMPDINGMELHKRLKQAAISMPVIIVTGHADVSMAVRAMKSGAYDFIEKPYNDSIMLERIQSAIAYDRDNRRQQERKQAIQERVATLTPREKQVMDYVLQSTQNKVIASELGVSIKTVELHRSNLMSKMQASSSTELVRLAMIAELE